MSLLIPYEPYRPAPYSRHRVPHTHPDLAVLHDDCGESGYAGVYPSDHGRWRARVCKRVNVRVPLTDAECGPTKSNFATREEAAWYVAQWLRWWHGPADWAEAFRCRKNNPWKTHRVNGGGVRVDVFLRGRPEGVCLAAATHGIPPLVFRRYPATGGRVATRRVSRLLDEHVWPTKRDAVEAAKAFMRHCLYHLLGVFAPCPRPPACLLFWRPRPAPRVPNGFGPSGEPSQCPGRRLMMAA